MVAWGVCVLEAIRPVMYRITVVIKVVATYSVSVIFDEQIFDC